MKETPWQFKVFLVMMAVTLIACQTVMGIPVSDVEIAETSSRESIPPTLIPLSEDNSSISDVG